MIILFFIFLLYLLIGLFLCFIVFKIDCIMLKKCENDPHSWEDKFNYCDIIDERISSYTYILKILFAWPICILYVIKEYNFNKGENDNE